MTDSTERCPPHSMSRSWNDWKVSARRAIVTTKRIQVDNVGVLIASNDTQMMLSLYLGYFSAAE